MKATVTIKRGKIYSVNDTRCLTIEEASEILNPMNIFIHTAFEGFYVTIVRGDGKLINYNINADGMETESNENDKILRKRYVMGASPLNACEINMHIVNNKDKAYIFIHTLENDQIIKDLNITKQSKMHMPFTIETQGNAGGYVFKVASKMAKIEESMDTMIIENADYVIAERMKHDEVQRTIYTNLPLEYLNTKYDMLTGELK